MLWVSFELAFPYFCYLGLGKYLLSEIDGLVALPHLCDVGQKTSFRAELEITRARWVGCGVLKSSSINWRSIWWRTGARCVEVQATGLTMRDC